jgi:hypothetical protein
MMAENRKPAKRTRPRLEWAYILVSPLPVVLFAIGAAYLRTLEGWAPLYVAGAIFQPIVWLSAVLGAVGLILTLLAKRAGRPLAVLLSATGVSSAVLILFLVMNLF